MQAKDVMTKDVVTVSPGTTIQEAARIMMERHVSGLPVVDAQGRLVGLISEGDLLHRAETGTARRRSWWLDLFATSEDRARDFVASHARTVEQVMTRRVVTAGPETPLDAIARLLEEHGVKRVPIVEGGRLVGLVSRADLVRALAVRKLAQPSAPPDDPALREAVLRVMAEEHLSGRTVNVVVDGGIVHLWGIVDSDAEALALKIAAEGVAGTGRVESHLTVAPGLVHGI